MEGESDIGDCRDRDLEKVSVGGIPCEWLVGQEHMRQISEQVLSLFLLLAVELLWNGGQVRLHIRLLFPVNLFSAIRHMARLPSQ